MLRFSTCFVLAALVIVGCESERPALEPEGGTSTAEPTIPFRQDGSLTFLRDGEPITEIAIEIADTDSARTRGLMQREGLPPQSGMLFVFPRETPQGFWMANTPIALDIIYVNADSQIVSIAKYTRPFSSQTVESEAPARYVVEVPAGFSDTYGLTESDRVRWTETE